MNVELGFVSELLKLAGPMKGVKSATDPVAEARHQATSRLFERDMTFPRWLP